LSYAGVTFIHAF